MRKAEAIERAREIATRKNEDRFIVCCGGEWMITTLSLAGQVFRGDLVDSVVHPSGEVERIRKNGEEVAGNE